MRYPLSEKARPDGSHPPDRADAVRRSERHPLRLSPVRQGCRRAARLQPALHRDDGPLGSGGDRRFRQGARSHPVQQRRHLQQFRASANFDRGYGRQRHRLHRRAESCEGRRAGFLHRGFRCSGDRRAGAGPRSQTGPRRDRTTRGRGYGQSDARSATDFRRKLRRTRPPLARRPFHPVGSKPGGRPRLPQALPSAQGEPRPRGQRKGGTRTTRSLGQMGHSVQRVVRLSQGDQPADAGGERRQRRDRLLGELVHPAAAPAERPAHPLSRRQSRLAVPVSRTLRPSRLDVPVGGRALGHVRIESGAAATTRKTIMATLTGKTALVTGASRGIGRASALALAAAGAQVLVHYGRGATEADGVVAEIRKAGGRADVVAADLERADGPDKLAKLARDIVGDRLDILVANAGVSKSATIEDTTVEDFDRLFAVNVRAPFFLVQQLLPILGDGSSVVLVSSLAAHASVGNLSAYAATKGAIDTLVKHFASVLGARGIRVNAVAPGVVETDMSNFTKSDAGRDFTLGMQALKRVAQPDDIGDVVAFLASHQARWVSGDTVHVDGGSKL